MDEIIGGYLIPHPEINEDNIKCSNCGETNSVDVDGLNLFEGFNCRKCNFQLI